MELSGPDTHPRSQAILGFIENERGLEAVSDTGPIEAAVDTVLAEHPDHVARLRGGEEKVRNFLIGQVMKRMGGKADPASVRGALARRLGEGTG